MHFRYIICSLISFSFFINISEASSWLCKESASIRNDDNYFVCGVATGVTEESARAQALTNASIEFNGICEPDATCKNREIKISPERNDCENLGNEYKCFRGFQYTLGKIKINERTSEQIQKDIDAENDKFMRAKEIADKEKELLEIKRKNEDKDYSEHNQSSLSEHFKENSSNMRHYFDLGFNFSTAVTTSNLKNKKSARGGNFGFGYSPFEMTFGENVFIPSAEIGFSYRSTSSAPEDSEGNTYAYNSLIFKSNTISVIYFDLPIYFMKYYLKLGFGQATATISYGFSDLYGTTSSLSSKKITSPEMNVHFGWTGSYLNQSQNLYLEIMAEKFSSELSDIFSFNIGYKW